ncbi:MAG: hypothetical protein NTX50_11940 [Candidatus Sumerlaeota bacterium]|nr:hypothetical protein [Candidatus Sumerlaeota bacterium]
MNAPRFAISVISHDRPGIISNVTETILKLGGNIDKMSQTVMDGCFTILIIAAFPPRCEADVIRDEILEAGKRLKLGISVLPYQEARPAPVTKHNVYFLTVMGRDRKGIVHEITAFLAGNDINILDLYCFLRPPKEFVLIGEIEVPPDRDLRQLQIDLEEIGAQSAISVRIQHENLFLATNDLYLTRQERLG